MSRERYELQLAGALGEHPQSLHLDCSTASLIASGHIELLWHTKTLCESNGASLDLDNPSIGLLRVLALLDLADQFIPGGKREEESATNRPTVVCLPVAEYEDQFEPTLEAVTAATWKFKVYLESLPLADLLRFELATVFYEVTNNIREHGMPPQDSVIRCDIRWGANEAVLEFSDFGKAYDPSRSEQILAAARTGAKRQRGYGLVLIRRLADSMTYRRTPDGQNILTLLKRWETAQ